MTSRREQIIETTCHLIELQGYSATGLNQILAESNAPKGSLYYYFPEGKDELVEAAISHTAQIIAERLRTGLAAHEQPVQAIPAFLRDLAKHVQASGFRAGGPITAVALEAASTNERLNTACRDTYRAWQTVVKEKLLSSGYEQARAQSLAVVTIALIEGAIILSRSERNVAPLLDAAVALERLL
jgi:TetR/AcrR family transcriptional repressor of lmrAB and yxaGH operons